MAFSNHLIRQELALLHPGLQKQGVLISESKVMRSVSGHADPAIALYKQ